MKIFIYKIYFPANGKCYIGQTNNLNRRMYEHLESKYPVGRALRKYDDWLVSYLHICNSRSDSNMLEVLEIQRFDSLKPGGHNLTIGGEGGSVPGNLKHTDAAKKIIGAASKGRCLGLNRPRHSKRMLGNQYAKGGPGHTQKHTDATKEKMRKPHLGVRGNRNPSHRIDVKIKKLKRHIDRLERELLDDRPTK